MCLTSSSFVTTVPWVVLELSDKTAVEPNLANSPDGGCWLSLRASQDSHFRSMCSSPWLCAVSTVSNINGIFKRADSDTYTVSLWFNEVGVKQYSIFPYIPSMCKLLGKDLCYRLELSWAMQCMLAWIASFPAQHYGTDTGSITAVVCQFKKLLV